VSASTSSIPNFPPDVHEALEAFRRRREARRAVAIDSPNALRAALDAEDEAAHMLARRIDAWERSQ
jgi:hypothetical protein